MVSVSEIELEDGGSLEEIKSRVYEWQGVFVFYGYVVHTPVIDAGAQGAIFLGHEEEPCSNAGGGRPDDSCGKGVTDVGFHSFSLRRREVEQMTGGQRGTREQVYGTIIGVMWRQGESMLFTEDLT